MKKLLLILIPVLPLLSACEFLDTKVDANITQLNLDNEYRRVSEVGYAAYGYIENGLYALDNNLAAAKSDEAVQTSLTASARFFNNGSLSAYNNPDNPYSDCYRGIRAANYFLDYSTDFVKMLAHARDTISDGGNEYRRDLVDIGRLRAEAHVLKAYYYFELIKRYGGVPLYKTVHDDNTIVPRASYDEVVEYIISEIDYAMDSLAADWVADASKDGRFTKGAARALKSRVLLYAASPLNSDGDAQRWIDAAFAAHDVIEMNQYSLSGDYGSLFSGNTSGNPEVIMSFRAGPSNSLERSNYPIATPGGNSGLTPSHNLVSSYEFTGPEDPTNPYVNRDPRLYATIVTNNSQWNNRTIDISADGTDASTNANASRTGYYLKKYLTDNLFLLQNQQAVHHWILFRYAEILLNYAEAANEAWGPDDGSQVSSGLTARAALNQVRQRVGLDPVDLTRYAGGDDKARMREAIKAERRVELAFEDHRYWDLLRWEDGAVLGTTIEGVHAVRTGADTFDYVVVDVEDRVFDPKMYRYPIPYEEVGKSNGQIDQNIGW